MLNESTYDWWTDEERELHREVNDFATSLRERNLEAMWSHEIPYDVIAELGRRRYYGAVIPTQYGGLSDGRGGDSTRLTIIMEALGRVAAATMAFGVGCAHHTATYGTEAQRERWLPGLASGEVLGAVAVTEPYAGSDAAGIQTRATRLPDGGYRLHGRKRFITHAGFANVYLVYARTSDDPLAIRERRHLSAFLVPADSEGVNIERINELGGSQYLRNGVIHFAGVTLDSDARLGEEGGGWQILTGGLNLERVAVAAKCLGMGDEALTTAWRWLRRRRQFGSSLDRLPTVRARLGTALSEMLASRALTYQSARRVDSDPEGSGLEGASSKLLATQVALSAASSALELMGADGYSRNYPVFQIVQDLRLYQVGGGSNDVLRGLVSRIGEKQFAKALEEMPSAVIPPSMTAAASDASADGDGQILEVLAQHYRVHSGLDMTAHDLRAAMGSAAGSADELAAAVRRLADADLVDAAWRGSELAAVRPTYVGLDEAFGPEYYRLMPEWAESVTDSVDF
jgi:acyl-CoA dehydrogenase